MLAHLDTVSQNAICKLDSCPCRLFVVKLVKKWWSLIAQPELEVPRYSKCWLCLLSFRELKNLISDSSTNTSYTSVPSLRASAFRESDFRILRIRKMPTGTNDSNSISKLPLAQHPGPAVFRSRTSKWRYWTKLLMRLLVFFAEGTTGVALCY